MPFDTYFDVDALKKFHKVVTMEEWMFTTAPKVWPKGKRIGAVCWSIIHMLFGVLQCFAMGGGRKRNRIAMRKKEILSVLSGIHLRSILTSITFINVYTLIQCNVNG